MYKVRRHGNRYKVYEVETSQYLYVGSKTECDDLCNKLNKGSGFEGNTPAFMTNYFEIEPEVAIDKLSSV